jgi:hypothetical protein
MSIFTAVQCEAIHKWFKEDTTGSSFTEFMDWVNENTKKKKSKSSKKDMDPNRVKRPVPASWMYREEKREEIIRDHFDGEAVKGNLIAKKAQELWTLLSDEEKRPYEDKRNILWNEYTLAKGNEPKETHKPKEEFTFKKYDVDVDVPEGWNGPYEGKYLHKYVTDLGKIVGKGLFSTLEEAMEAASRNDNCKGVTLCKFGYTLREGGEPRTNPKYEATSWVKSSVKKSSGKKSSGKKSSVKKSSEKKSSGKKSSDKPKGKSVGDCECDNEGSDYDESDKDEHVDVKLEEKRRQEAERILESDEEDEDEDEDEDEYEAEVVEWTYEGQEYLLDEESHIVYSSKTQEPIGKRTKKAGKWTLKLD